MPRQVGLARVGEGDGLADEVGIRPQLVGHVYHQVLRWRRKRERDGVCREVLHRRRGEARGARAVPPIESEREGIVAHIDVDTRAREAGEATRPKRSLDASVAQRREAFATGGLLGVRRARRARARGDGGRKRDEPDEARRTAQIAELEVLGGPAPPERAGLAALVRVPAPQGVVDRAAGLGLGEARVCRLRDSERARALRRAARGGDLLVLEGLPGRGKRRAVGQGVGLDILDLRLCRRRVVRDVCQLSLDCVRLVRNRGVKPDEPGRAPLARAAHIVVVGVGVGDVQALAVDGEPAAGIGPPAARGREAEARHVGLRQPEVVGAELLLAEGRLLRENRKAAGGRRRARGAEH